MAAKTPSSSIVPVLLPGRQCARCVQLLQGVYVDDLALKCGDSLRGRARCGHRGDGGDALLHRGTADGLLVEKSVLPLRSVDDEVNGISFDQIDDVGTPLFHLVDALHSEPGTLQHISSAMRRYEPETKLDVVTRERNKAIFVAVIHTEENRAAQRKPLPCRELRFGERFSEIIGYAHHLASGAHLRTQHRIHSRK